MWNEREVIEDTDNPYIWRIKTNGSNLSEKEFFGLLNKLNAAAENLDFAEVRKTFMEIIPEANLEKKGSAV